MIIKTFFYKYNMVSARSLFQWFILALLLSPHPSFSQNTKPNHTAMVRLVTVDPGHFHAALVQKSMYPQVDPLVHVYAPGGSDVQLHLDRIKAYNTRTESPTAWKEEVYAGNDFFEKMLADKSGNVVVLAGNNRKKTEYINKSLKGGFHVLADKPMVNNSGEFGNLKEAFKTATEKHLLLYDIMTERFEITTMLQKALSVMPAVFGTLEKGTEASPAVTMKSIHYFYKAVSGDILTRPAWFMDVTQQGEGIVDVTTHLVDLVQWECFPGKTLGYTDVNVTAAKRWATDMSLDEFKAITKLDAFPDYLKKDIAADNVLKVYSNGEISYTLKGVHAKVTAVWDYKAPDGSGDTHYSFMHGTKADLVIRQEAEQQYKPELYIEPRTNDAAYETLLRLQMKPIQAKYPGVELVKTTKGWQVTIPDKYRDGHEAHFAAVTKNFLDYLQNHNMPSWEVPNMLTKYYTTTKALEMAKGK